jgi:dTDP-glucose pyrophosphorylase
LDRPFSAWQRGERTCVVMAGGRSSRFLASTGTHKSMAQVRGMPVIAHVIDYWRAHADEFVFVVKNGKEDLSRFVATLPIEARFVEPAALRGIANGLLAAEPLVRSPFIMVLGDCYCRGRFTPPQAFTGGHAIGVQRSALAQETRRNYAVEVSGNRVTRVEEKPAHVPNDLCGTGFYFFQPDVFDAVRSTPASARTGEHEITDVLQTLADGPGLQAVWFDGDYININAPEDLAAVEAACAVPATSQEAG